MAILATLALAAAPPLAQALDIQMTFKSGSSVFPSYDPDGAQLTAMMTSVESYYEDIFEAAGTLQVEFYYADLTGSTLAVHNNLATSGGKPTKCRIRVDTDRTWYFDATPTNNSEYEMERTLYRDLTSSEKTDFFNDTPNSLLEVSHVGDADWDTAPWDCIVGYDLWSIVLHEMGHGLGMTANVASGEVSSDYDYDFDPDLVWGSTAAAECSATDNLYHLDAETLMYPNFSWGTRRLPTATDIFSMETSATWGDTTIDLRLKDFYSADANANFSSPANWSGNHLPDSADDCWVRDGGDATLSAEVQMHNLTVAESSATIYTGAYRLYVAGNASLGDGTNYARVYVQNGGEFQVNYTLTVANNADVQMDAGSLLDIDTLTVNVGGEILGAGTIDIEDALTNNGKITVSGGNLTIDSDVNVNLDGVGDNDGAGQIYVTGGDFSCNKALTDNFTGYIQVNSGRTATFTEGWRILTGGTLYLNGSTDSAYRAAIEGGLFQIAGAVNVNNKCRILCDSAFESTAVVTMTDRADTLYVHDTSTIQAGASFSGAGWIYVNAVLTLEDNASVGTRLCDNNDVIVVADGIGDATIGGEFTVTANGMLLMEADGDNSCDLLDVNANAILGGTLSMTFLDEYVPEDGDTFTVLNYNSRSGTFASILSSNPLVSFTAAYGSTALTLTAVVGDGLAAVPEPGTLTLLLGAALCAGFARRRRNR